MNDGLSYPRFAALLTAGGYVPAAPPRVSRETLQIDREVAEDTPCERCGGRCRFEAWAAKGSYIAVAVCMSCSRALEF